MKNNRVELYYEYLCEQHLKELAPDLHQRYCNSITRLFEVLDSYQVRFPLFTDHTMLHSINVIKFCNTLIANNIKYLNADEVYVLLMSAYLHDSGMGISEADYEIFCQNINIENYSKVDESEVLAEIIRDFHHEFSGEFIKKYASQFDIPSEYVFAIVQILRGHRKTNLYDEKEYSSKYTLSNGNTICLPYLAALLRLADEIDVAADRNNLSMYEKKYEDIYDIKKFNRHRAIQRVIIEQDCFVMELDVKGDMELYDDIILYKKENGANSFRMQKCHSSTYLVCFIPERDCNCEQVKKRKHMNTIAKRILSNVQKHPQKIAIVDCDGTRETTWAQLLEVSTKIACHARREGLCGIVPILQGRTMEYVASILGLNMAGIAAVNLSDTYPEERVKYICEDVGATACVDSAFVEQAMSFPIEPFEPCGDLSSIAMLLYTSGSTGIPKGIVYDNNCILQSILRNIKEVGIDESVIYANTAIFSFAITHFDVLTPLAAGATVHILTENCRKDITELTSYLNQHQITHAFIPFQLLKQIHSPLPFMKQILLAGEKINDIAPQSYKTIICYAMSETTAFVTYFTLDKAYDTPPIGKPAKDMVAYLLDENGNLCDEGEICVAGGIAKGYWNLPELTAKTFVPNPFATGEHDKVLLHTGDIAKRLPDGNLLYLNRNDWMIKISGQRVEPSEIEVVMCQIPEIKQAVVKGFVNANGQTYLCGFYTVSSSVSREEIRAYLAKKLPDYMQPRFLTQLVSFPTNANGKVDRLSLQAPKVAEFQAEYTAPETLEEELLCRAFETALDIQSVGVFDDFFHMGGDSLGIMQLKVAAESLHVKTEHVFIGKTPRGIARLLKKEHTLHEDLYSDCQEEKVFYPLTSPQKIVLQAYLLAPWSTAWNIPSVYTFPLESEPERIRKALLAVFAHYPILRIKIAKQDGIYGMVERPDMKLEIPIIDIQEADIPQKKREFAAIPFNLEEDLLIRTILYRTEKQTYLFWDVCHIIMDGSSVNLFFSQFLRAYHREALLPQQLTQFHLSNYEQKYVKSELFQQAQDFFDQKLAGHIFPSEPAFDHPEYGYGVRKSRHVLRTISDEALLNKLQQFVNTHNITAATFFAGVLAYTLKEVTKNEQTYFLSIESGRHDLRLQSTLGQLIKYMPITVSFEQKSSVIERLRKLQTDFIESWSYDCYPLEQMECRYGVSNSVILNYLGELKDELNLSGHIIPMEFLIPESNNYNLLVFISKYEKKYDFGVVYNSQAYEESTIDAFMDTYVQVINSILE